LLAKAAGQLASMLNRPPSSRASPLPHRIAVYTISATAPIPCGSEPARDEIPAVPAPNKPPASPANPAPTEPGYTLSPTHASLRLCLQLRQNPPACAPCPGVLLSSCHCPSVVGFSSPDDIPVARVSSVRHLPALDGGCALGAFGRAGLGVSPVY
jgi:hypothetical protein